MTFSGCGSYCKDTCDYDEYIANVYNVLHKPEGMMTALKSKRVCYLLLP